MLINRWESLVKIVAVSSRHRWDHEDRQWMKQHGEDVLDRLVEMEGVFISCVRVSSALGSVY